MSQEGPNVPRFLRDVGEEDERSSLEYHSKFFADQAATILYHSDWLNWSTVEATDAERFPSTIDLLNNWRGE